MSDKSAGALEQPRTGRGSSAARTYARLGGERLEDIAVLCATCAPARLDQVGIHCRRDAEHGWHWRGGSATATPSNQQRT